MRKVVLGVLAASAAIAIGASPASACHYAGGCALNHTGYGTYGYLGVAPYDRLPQPTGRYSPAPHPQGSQVYFVDQGPTYSGPGEFAPYPSYQETAVRGWRGYERGYDYPYDGGPYGNAVNHYSDVAPSGQGPVVTSYRWRHGRAVSTRVKHFGIRPTRNAFAAHVPGSRIASPGVTYAPRFSVARHKYPRSPRPAY